MKKIILGVFLAAWTAFPATAFAAAFQGTITALDQKSMNLTSTDMSGRMKDLKIGLDYSKVQLQGMTSVADLEVGDYVTVDAKKNPVTRHLKARAISYRGPAPANRPDQPIKKGIAAAERTVRDTAPGRG
ncbi:MAG TPA: hypothetical protein VL404_06025 [Candidatus Eisenbacteria bacterium]|nr:hypothetical protein [Candidatus Eisenbacteria bacterium]